MPATGGGTAAAGVTLPSLSEIQNWDTSHLVTAARQWGETAGGWEDGFSVAHRAAASPGGTSWKGQAAEAVRARSLEDLYRVRGWADTLDTAARAARAAAIELQSAKEQVLDSVRRAEAAGFDVHDDLSLSTRHGVTAAEYAAKLAEGQSLSAEITARALHLAALDAEVAGRITAAVAPLGEVGFAEAPAQMLDTPLTPHLSPTPEPDGSDGSDGEQESDSTKPKTWQDMLLPEGPAAAEAEDSAPTLQDQLFPQGGAVPAEQAPSNLDQALEATAPGLGAAMEQQRQAALSRVPSVQDLKSDPKVVAAARGILEAQGVAPQDMEAALDRFLEDTHRLSGHMALNPALPSPDHPVPQPAPGFVDGFRDRWFSTEEGLKALFGTGGPKAPGVLESWGNLLAGTAETIANPVGAVKDQVEDFLNAPSTAYYLGEKAFDAGATAVTLPFGGEGAAVRAGLPAEIATAGGAPTALLRGWDPTGHLDWEEFVTRFGTPDTPVWPGNNGFPEGFTPQPVHLPEGTIIDRFGSEYGRFLAPDAAPFTDRALPPESVGADYRRYMVTGKPLPEGWQILQGPVAPWFGQAPSPGAVQYMIVGPDGVRVSVKELVDRGILDEYGPPLGR